MNFTAKIALLVALCLISTAEASIFLQKMTSFLTTPQLPQFIDFMAWQVLAILGPIIMGPLRVVTYIFWNMSFSNTSTQTIGSGGSAYTGSVTFDGTGAVKAYWFLNSGVTSFDKFTQFFYDIIIYGIVYPMAPSSILPQSANKPTINMLLDAATGLPTNPSGTCCYNWNNYDTTGNIPFSQIGTNQAATGCVLTFSPAMNPTQQTAYNSMTNFPYIC